MDSDVVTVTLAGRGAASPASTSLSARFLVGADGGRSTVRRLLGIGVEQLGSEGHHLATLFRADLSSVLGDHPSALNLVVAPGLEGVLVAAGEPGRWMYDMEWNLDGAAWTIEAMTARIRAAAGLPDLAVQISGMFPWDFGAEVAHQQALGRTFLVGDAAHRTTPRGATGMNTGIADGHNLGWKLGWVARGWAAPALLDSYALERALVGRANAEASMVTAVGADSAHSIAQDFDVVYATGALLGSGRLVGRRAPHVWLTAGGRQESTIDLFEGRLTRPHGLVRLGVESERRCSRSHRSPCGRARSGPGAGRTHRRFRCRVRPHRRRRRAGPAGRLHRLAEPLR